MLHDDWGTLSERWAGIRSESIDVNGTAVNVLRAGDDHDPSSGSTTPDAERLPQLLVHGLGGSATNWLEIMAPLAKRGPVIAPDLPGFGRTEPPRTSAARVGSNARFLTALLRELGWDRVQVQGNSMGGLLAVLLAGNSPELVERLVLVSPALTASPTAVSKIDPATLLRLGPFLIPGVGERLMRRTYEKMTTEELFDDTAQYLHADPEKVAPELREVGLANVDLGREYPWRLPSFSAAATSTVRMVTSRLTLERAMARVQAPTLVVWGDRDRLIGRPVIDRMAALRADWTIEVFDDVGHVAMVESPQRYLDTVVPWLDADHGDVAADADAVSGR